MATKKIKTAEATGPVLDWMVNEAQGRGQNYLKFWNMGGDKRYVHCEVMNSPSTSWDRGGPILDEYEIIYGFHSTHRAGDNDRVHASFDRAQLKPDGSAYWYAPAHGPTVLIATMRSFAMSRLGEEVEVPEELTWQ